MNSSGSEEKPAAGGSYSRRTTGDDGVKLRHEEPASGCGLGCAELGAVLLVIAGSAALVLLLGR